ncbi:fimbrial protein [Paraburkholderia sp. BL25I1N1]|uniref:fimbrial protein n=1 Tax=Paraburkholderia sp. BL25I1N1 TaxID=1938804 RepID=UPI000D446862|nr:fimbrial protein [Paraburkholderia sp. BL25I1N1]PRY05876.1 type 1 fimbria pilin [Paraburkholderia sp. BL25I1N1]
MQTVRHLEATRTGSVRTSAVTGFMSRHLRSLTIATAWALLLSGMCASEAKADCSWLNGETTENYTFNIPTLSISRDAAVGTVVYAAPVQPANPPSANFATCSGNVPANRTVTGGAQVSANPYTFATNVPGIGIQFFDEYGGARRFWGAGSQEIYNGQWTWGGTMLGVQVVITGQVATGTISGALVGTFKLGSLTVANLRVTSASVTASTCSVATQALAVTLPTVSPSAFQNVGSTAGSQPVSISLNCGASNARVYITLTDNTSPTNTSSILSLKPGSSAQGVGLQILSGGIPVNFGVDSAAAGNLNQWFVGTASGGSMNIPLTVRYIKTSTPVSAGTVGGVATFTMSYQ